MARKKEQLVLDLLTNKVTLTDAARIAKVPKEEMELELIRYVDHLEDGGQATDLGYKISALTKTKIGIRRHLELNEWLEADRAQHQRVMSLGTLAEKAITNLLEQDDPDPKEIKACVSLEKDLRGLMDSRVNVTKETTPLIHQTINSQPQAQPASLPAIEDVKAPKKELTAIDIISEATNANASSYEDVFDTPSVEGLLDNMELEK